MKRANIKIKKEKEGKVIVTITKDDRVMQLDVNDCCILSDKLDEFLFGKNMGNNRVRTMLHDANVPEMNKEEMHDLLYDYSYTDGTQFSKAMSVKLVQLRDLGKVETFGKLFNMYGNILAKHTTVKG